MRRSWRLFALGVPATALLAAMGALAEPQIGHVVQRQFNGATGARQAATSVDNLVYTQDVFAGEKVITPAGGSTVVRFRDQTQLQVGANSTVVLDRFVYDPSSQSDSGSINLAKGLFRYIGGQASDAAGVKLSTPTTTLTIRGTKFMVWVKDDGTTTVGVLEGAVDVKPCGNGDIAHANAGQAYQVTSSCTATPVPMSSVPTDPATAGDASVDNGAGGANGGDGSSNPGGGGGSPSSGGGGSTGRGRGHSDSGGG